MVAEGLQDRTSNDHVPRADPGNHTLAPCPRARNLAETAARVPPPSCYTPDCPCGWRRPAGRCRWMSRRGSRSRRPRSRAWLWVEVGGRPQGGLVQLWAPGVVSVEGSPPDVAEL